ncbi:MAG: hypothetical protein ACK4S4_04105 [Pyrinomonadaceae bacterium]
MTTFNQRSDEQGRHRSDEACGPNRTPRSSAGSRRAAAGRGSTAIWQARLVLFVMINIAQLWILSAAIEAALAGHYGQLVPLVAASFACWAIALTIFLWWKPAASRRSASTGFVAKK